MYRTNLGFSGTAVSVDPGTAVSVDAGAVETLVVSGCLISVLVVRSPTVVTDFFGAGAGVVLGRFAGVVGVTTEVPLLPLLPLCVEAATGAATASNEVAVISANERERPDIP